MMSRTLRILLAAVMLFSAALAGTAGAASAASAAAPVPVAVDWGSKLSETTPFSFGLNGFMAFDPAIAGHPQYQRNLDYMNVGFLRYHAAEAMNDYRDHHRGWLDKTNRTWAKDRIRAALAAMPGDGPVKLIDIYGWPSWMKTYDVRDAKGAVVATLLDPSEFDNFAAFCAELVRFVNVESGFGVKYWEITNERDDIYYVKLRNAGLPDKLDELIEMYNRAAKAMKAVDPGIKTGGLAFARGDLYDQVERFVSGTVNETAPTTLDFLSYHFYANGDLTESDEYVYERIHDTKDPNRGTLAKHTKDIREIVDRLSPDRRIPIYLNEFNISWTWTNNDPRMQNHKGAVFDALSMIYAHLNGADGTNAWNEMDGVYGKTDGQYALRPPAHAFQLFNNYLVGDVAPATTGSERAIVPFAVQDPATGARSLLLVNRTNEVQRAAVAFAGWTPPSASAQLHQISSQGYTVSAVGWNQLLGAPYALPPHSVTLVTSSGSLPSIVPQPLPPVVPQGAGDGAGDGSGGSDQGKPMLAGFVANAGKKSLSDEGAIDWVYWGATAPGSVDRKAGTPVIGELAPVGKMDLFRVAGKDYGEAKTWNGGPEVKRVGVITGGKDAQNGNRPIGWEFTVPADTTLRSLKIYAGAIGARGVIEASLSDGSAPAYVTGGDGKPDAIESKSWITNKEITLNYRAASAGQTLKVRYTLAWNHWGDESIWLQAAALSEPDDIPPSVPGGMEALSVTSTTAAFAWDASTDQSGVKGYRVYNGNQLLGSTEGTSWFVKGLLPGETYHFHAAAYDATGNLSAKSLPVTVATPPDALAPTVPGGLTVVRESADALALTWSGSVDDAGGVTYEIVRNGEVVARTAETAYRDTESIGSYPVYTYTVAAVDAAGNRSVPTGEAAVVTDATLGGVGRLLEGLQADGAIAGNALTKQLDASLKQAEHHASQGRTAEAGSHLRKLLEQLQTPPASSAVSERALADATLLVNAVLAEMEKQA